MGKCSKDRGKEETALAIPGSLVQGIEFPVLLDMRHQSVLGLDVDWTDGQTLYIKSVQPGAVADWNMGHAHTKQVVQPGGRILEVNGFRGDPIAMASLCRELCISHGMLSLVVRGPPLPPSALKARRRDGRKKGKNKQTLTE